MLFTIDVASLLNQIGTNNAILEKGDIVSNGATTDDTDGGYQYYTHNTWYVYYLKLTSVSHVRSSFKAISSCGRLSSLQNQRHQADRKPQALLKK
jgi:hypothetical protein